MQGLGHADRVPVSGAACATELQAASEMLRAMVWERTAGGGCSKVRRLGVGQSGILVALERLAKQTWQSVLNAQPVIGFNPYSNMFELDELSRRRSVRMELLVSRRSIRLHPLLPILEPTARVAPLYSQFLISDDATLAVAGPPTSAGEPTIWLVTEPMLLAKSREIWAASYALSVPAADFARGFSPLSPRQIEVTRGLCRGEKDAVIARRLNTSPRTVERDIAGVLTFLEVDGRCSGIRRIMGGVELELEQPKGG